MAGAVGYTALTATETLPSKITAQERSLLGKPLSEKVNQPTGSTSQKPND